MKKFLTAIGLSLTLATPLFAETKQTNLKSHTTEAFGCMILLECKEGVERVSLDYQFGENQQEHLEEIKNIIGGLNKLNVEFYIGDEKYFPLNTNGVYKPKLNRLFLRRDLLENRKEFIKTLRHEGWHVVQDAMAGGVQNTFIAQIHQDNEIPETLLLRVRLLYGLAGQTAAMSWEIDANYAELQPGKTAKYLEMAAVKPLWEQIEPTPFTKEWLVGCGYMKPEGKLKLYKNTNDCKEREN